MRTKYVLGFSVRCFIQGDQLDMAVFFWYQVESDVSSVHVYNSIHRTSHLLQGTRKTRQCLTGHPVVQKWEGKILGEEKECGGVIVNTHVLSSIYTSIILHLILKLIKSQYHNIS